MQPPPHRRFVCYRSPHPRVKPPNLPLLWLGCYRKSQELLGSQLRPSRLNKTQRDKLERLCRFISRPPVAERRLLLTTQGKVRYRLNTLYRDDTAFEPLDFIAKLAALVPRPRVNSPDPWCLPDRTQGRIDAKETLKLDPGRQTEVNRKPSPLDGDKRRSRAREQVFESRDNR